MTNQNEARGLIAVKSSLLEEYLRKAGATGMGLKELSESVGHLFDDAAVARIRRVYELRNKAMHQHVFHIDQPALDRYLSNVDSIINILAPNYDPGLDHFRQIAATGSLDDDAYEWLKAEVDRRESARQAALEASSQASGHNGEDLAQSGDKDLKSNRGRLKLLSPEQRDRLAFDKQSEKPAQIQAKKLSLPPAVKEAAQDLVIKVGVKAVLSVFKII